MLVLYLIISIDDVYKTTIEILNSTQLELTLAHTQKQLQSKETELADVKRGELVNYASRGRSRRGGRKGNCSRG